MQKAAFRKCIPLCVLALASFGAAGGAGAWTFRTVYAFQGGNDGAVPLAAVMETGGVLYGTTSQGGSSNCGNSGCGTIFQVTTTGQESVLATFGYGYSDGNTPRAPLLNVSGTLYGTAEQGGIGDGVIFSVTPSGTENTLHVFQGGSNDGALPFAGMINVNGTLYGTTAGGGGAGTVFSITPDGSETIFYKFKGQAGGDGSAPQGAVTRIKGTLYGTTFGGGTQGDGTVYKLTLSGREKVLHSFSGGSDGNTPFAGLTNVNGTLYGTTMWGGGTGCGGRGCGTIFKITTAGDETVVYRFQGGTDGANPEADLLNVKGTLYGTTRVGGATSCGNTTGCGTVFKVTPAGAVKIIHTFTGADGSLPQAGLIDAGGTLYGTTSGGIGTNCAGGCGSVFALSK
jgi:uncharacterized repeat protein (TIGR03803 family)